MSEAEAHVGRYARRGEVIGGVWESATVALFSGAVYRSRPVAVDTVLAVSVASPALSILGDSAIVGG